MVLEHGGSKSSGAVGGLGKPCRSPMALSQAETSPNSEREKGSNSKVGDHRWWPELVNMSAQSMAEVEESLTEMYLLSFQRSPWVLLYSNTT